MISSATSWSSGVRPSRHAPGVADRQILPGPLRVLGNALEQVALDDVLDALWPAGEVEPTREVGEVRLGVGEEVLVVDAAPELRVMVLIGDVADVSAGGPVEGVLAYEVTALLLGRVSASCRALPLVSQPPALFASSRESRTSRPSHARKIIFERGKSDMTRSAPWGPLTSLITISGGSVASSEPGFARPLDHRVQADQGEPPHLGTPHVLIRDENA